MVKQLDQETIGWSMAIRDQNTLGRALNLLPEKYIFIRAKTNKHIFLALAV